MKRLLSMSVLLQAVTGVMTLALMTVFAVYAVNALDARDSARRVPAMVDISNDLFAAIQYLRSERGSANTALLTADVVAREQRDEIAGLREKSGMAFDSALAKIATIGFGGTGPAIGEIRLARNAYERVHREVEAALLKPRAERAQDLSARWVDANVKLRDT